MKESNRIASLYYFIFLRFILIWLSILSFEFEISADFLSQFQSSYIIHSLICCLSDYSSAKYCWMYHKRFKRLAIHWNKQLLSDFSIATHFSHSISLFLFHFLLFSRFSLKHHMNWLKFATHRIPINFVIFALSFWKFRLIFTKICDVTLLIY